MRAWFGRGRPAAAVVGVVMLLGCAGCGSGADVASEADRAAAMATTHGGTAGDELILPVNAYDFTVPERNRLTWARQVLVGACLRRLGFGYDAATTTAQYKRLAATDLADHGVYGNKRRYVVTDPATAGKYGYHLVSTVTGTQAAAGRRDPHGPGATNVAEREALIGVGPGGKPVTHTAGGRPVPAGGCVGAADASLSHSGSVGEAKPVSRLDGASYKQSLHDAKVVAAFGAWSRCMAGRGYHIADPVKVSDGFNLAVRTVTAREITTAKADVTCKQKTQLTEIWFNSEVTYQKKQIQQNAGQFHQTKIDHDTIMKAAAKILTGAQ